MARSAVARATPGATAGRAWNEPPCRATRRQPCAAGNAAGARGLALVRGRAGARRRHARAAAARGRGPDRPERRGQVDARQPHDRVRPPHVGHDRARRPRDHGVEPAPACARRARAHVPALEVVPRPHGAREHRGRRARRGRRAARGAQARRRAAAAAEPDRPGRSPAGSLAHGDERRLGVARALAMRAELRAHGRARRRAARGRGARVRRRRARRARRPRRGRAADRSQHGADHGRLRPHPRARPGRDARRGRAGRDPRQPRRRRRPTSARAPCARTTTGERGMLEIAGARRELRRRRGRARPLDRGRQGRDRRPDRPQRRGQVDDAARRSWASSTPRGGEIRLAGAVAARPLARGGHALGHLARPRGAAHLRRPDGRGESSPRPLRAPLARRRRRGRRGRLRALPDRQGVPAPAGRRALGRPAAAARDRARARRAARRPAARRAVARPRAEDRRRRLRDARARSASAASRCCSSSSARSARWRSPTAPT